MFSFYYKWQLIFLLSWLINLLRLDGRILRLHCKTVAVFSIERKGYLLQGYVINEFMEVGLHECYEHCMFDKRCKSINIDISEYGTCQLNGASSHDSMDNVTLTKNPNWIFKSTNYSDLKVGKSFFISIRSALFYREYYFKSINA